MSPCWIKCRIKVHCLWSDIKSECLQSDFIFYTLVIWPSMYHFNSPWEHTAQRPLRPLKLIVHIVFFILPGTILYLSTVKSVKWLSQRHDIEPMSQCCKGETLHFSENLIELSRHAAVIAKHHALWPLRRARISKIEHITLPRTRLHTRKHETLIQCRLNVGPTSATLVQH